MEKATIHLKFGKWTTLISIFLLLAIPRLYSQNQDPSIEAGISIGPSFPMGKFSSTATDSNSIHSAANPGLAIQLSFSFPFKHSHFGLGFITSWQQNSVNTSHFEQNFQTRFPNSDRINVQIDYWHIWRFLAGPVWNIPVLKNGKTRFACGIEAGLLKTSIPTSSVEIYYSGILQTYMRVDSRDLPVAFCYQVHAGIDYSLSRTLSLTGVVNFSHADPAYTYTYYLDPPVDSYAVYSKRIYSISSLNILLGIAYAL
jgi:hypothetical protein